MTTTGRSNLKSLYAQWRPGYPWTSKDLAARGISADLAVYYARAGWLKRLAPGVFVRPGDELNLYASLRLLERKLAGLHVGGRSALQWYKVQQYIRQGEALHLYGRTSRPLPNWFSQQFPAEYHQKRLFKEEAGALLHAGPFEGNTDAPATSTSERALLELLSEVGLRQPMQEARELVESTYSFRSQVMQELLQSCTSVKVVRLCLSLGKELAMPWYEKLDVQNLPRGSRNNWISRSADGILVLKP